MFLLRFIYVHIYLYRHICIKSTYLLAVDLLPNLVFRRNSEKLETAKRRARFMIFKMTEHTCLQASRSTWIRSTWVGWDWSSMKLINTDFVLKGLLSTFRHLWPKSKKELNKSYCIGWAQGLGAHVICKELCWGGLICSLWAPMSLFSYCYLIWPRTDEIWAFLCRLLIFWKASRCIFVSGESIQLFCSSLCSFPPPFMAFTSDSLIFRTVGYVSPRGVWSRRAHLFPARGVATRGMSPRARRRWGGAGAPRGNVLVESAV